MRPRYCLIALPLAALAFAGCGGDGGSDSDASAPATTTAAPISLSKEELISQGDAICAEVNAAIGTVGLSDTSSEGQVGQVADLYIGLVDSLQGLGTPDDTAGYDEVMSAADDLAQAESDAKLADERGDSAALGTAQTEATSALIAFQSAAQSYGFQDCGEGPSAPSAASTTTTPSPAAAPTATTPSAPTTTPAPAPSTGGAAGGTAGGTGGGSTGGGTAGSGGSTGGSSGGIGPG